MNKKIYTITFVIIIEGDSPSHKESSTHKATKRSDELNVVMDTKKETQILSSSIVFIWRKKVTSTTSLEKQTNKQNNSSPSHHFLPPQYISDDHHSSPSHHFHSTSEESLQYISGERNSEENTVLYEDNMIW